MKNIQQSSRYANLFRHVDNWWTHFSIKSKLTRRDPVVLRLKNGISAEVPLRQYNLFKEVVLDDCYLRGLDGFEVTKPLILDIGANVGFFSLYMASRFPEARIHAYEPMPINFEMLEKNFGRNDHAQLRAVGKAVSSSTDPITLHYTVSENKRFPTGATLFSGGKNDRSVDVESIRLQDILEELKGERVDLLKLDCEGAEFGIIYSTPKECFANIANIAMEVHPGEEERENIEALENYLREVGYRTETYHKGLLLWAWRE